jgi:ATP-dependent RNA helicase SUPV3L1/SUV3
VDSGIDGDAYTALGYPVFGPRALRADIVERVLEEIQQLARAGDFALPEGLADKAGVRREEVPELLAALGAEAQGQGIWRMPARARRRAQ